MENPKGIEYTATYKPDMDKMVKALRIVQEAPNKEEEPRTNLEDRDTA